MLTTVLAACLLVAACSSDSDSGDDTTPPSSSTTASSTPTSDDTKPSDPGTTDNTGPDDTDTTGDTTDDTDTSSDTTDDGTAAPSGVVTVSLEEVEGIFTEGFEIGLRFETTDGEVIASTLWSDFVLSETDGEMDDFYQAVLEQSVPAGDIVVLATANVGIGPPPEIPDLEGELDCRLEVPVPEDGQVDVEVSFSGNADCLRVT